VIEYKDETPSIAGIAAVNPNFSTLEGAAFKGGVVGVLSNSNPNDPSDYTVFAPTNDAFAKFLVDVAWERCKIVSNTLLYHVSNGDFTCKSNCKRRYVCISINNYRRLK
jgi:uncharacterized surface protein with fasciclin (FAS1) repeats